MGWFSSFGRKKKKQKQEENISTVRQGKVVASDDVFKAWTSGNLDEMLQVVNLQTNLIDRHFLLQAIVTESYKLRNQGQFREICIEFAEKHLSEFPAIAPVLKEDMGGKLPRVTTFQHYATLLTENKEYEKAVTICEQAIAYGLQDGTKSGFEGRIARIEKKSGQENIR